MVYLVFLFSLVAIDLAWLLGLARNLYRDEMGDLIASEPKLWAGLSFYLLYAVGACIFAVIPALSKQSWTHALQYGLLFGLFCYMTYDLTSLAIIRDFPVRLAFLDIAWGASVTAAASSIAYWVGNRIS